MFLETFVWILLKKSVHPLFFIVIYWYKIKKSLYPLKGFVYNFEKQILFIRRNIFLYPWRTFLYPFCSFHVPCLNQMRSIFKKANMSKCIYFKLCLYILWKMSVNPVKYFCIFFKITQYFFWKIVFSDCAPLSIERKFLSS